MAKLVTMTLPNWDAKFLDVHVL